MKATILLIEDDVDFRKTLVKALVKEGYAVLDVATEKEALAAAQKQTAGLIITDVRLAGAVDGIDVVAKIKAMPAYKEAKVLIMTGYADTEAPIRAIKVGVVDYFYKPFKLQDFLKKIKSCFDSVKATPQVLVIEDDADFRKTLLLALKRKGYLTVGVPNGIEALKAAQEQVFDLIISDVRLPGDEDGIEIVGKIKERLDHLKAKVLIITGYADTDAPIRAIKLGVVDYFIKPFNLSEFFMRVEECLASRETIDALELANESFDKTIESLKKIMEKHKAPKSYKRKKDGRLRIAMTGATGLLGRNLLFEIIKQNCKRLDKLDIFVLGRRQDESTIKQRIQAIIKEDGIDYIGDRDYKKLCKCIHAIEMDLVEEKLRLSDTDLKMMQAGTIDYFFHVAALTDFRSQAQVVKNLYNTNVYGTKKILELVSSLTIGEFCYVGSAYACGEVSGNIQPDYINLNQRFRNPYEKTKLEAEMLVRIFAATSGVRCRYFRPSTICGRLMENPLGATSKFDVFYAWAAGLLRMKQKFLKEGQDKYAQKVNLDMRICYNEESGLNIVPVDYCAKIMYQACLKNDKGESYHLVNGEEVLNALYMPIILETLNIQGIKVTKFIPEDKNKLEKFYYKTIGNVFTPYIACDPILFNTDNLKGITKRMKCRRISKEIFKLILNYAKENDFQMKG